MTCPAAADLRRCAETTRRGRDSRRPAALLAIVAALVLAASWAELHDILTRHLPAAEALIRERPLLGVTVFVLFAAASAMLAFVSSALLVPVAVYVWGAATALLLLWVGWILGGVCAYTISRSFGRAVAARAVPAQALSRYEHLVSQHGRFGFVLLLQLALPSEIPGYLLGLVRYRFWKYLAALALAELPLAVATVYLGAGFIERRFTLLVGVGAAVVMFSAWALHTLHRRIERESAGAQRPAAPQRAPGCH